MKGRKLAGQQSGDRTVILPNVKSRLYTGVLPRMLAMTAAHSSKYRTLKTWTLSAASAL